MCTVSGTYVFQCASSGPQANHVAKEAVFQDRWGMEMEVLSRFARGRGGSYAAGCFDMDHKTWWCRTLNGTHWPFGGMGTFATVGTGAICSVSESVFEIKIKFDLSNTLLFFDLLAKIVPIEVVPTELEELTYFIQSLYFPFDRSVSISCQSCRIRGTNGLWTVHFSLHGPTPSNAQHSPRISHEQFHTVSPWQSGCAPHPATGGLGPETSTAVPAIFGVETPGS